MLRFTLEQVTATLENLNTRTEKSGQDKVPACDLKISAALAASVLDAFEPTLKARYFNENGPRDLADGLPLRDPREVYPHTRSEEMENVTVKIGYGVGAPMVFTECHVDRFSLTPKEGGTVIVGFRVQCKPEAHEQLPHLYLLQEKGIELWVEPAPLVEMQEAA